MAFQKHQGGRPRGAKNRVNTDAAKLFQQLGGRGGRRYAEQLHQLATGSHDDPHVRIKALAIIAPYVWGKPIEQIMLGGDNGKPVVFQWKS